MHMRPIGGIRSRLMKIVSELALSGFILLLALAQPVGGTEHSVDGDDRKSSDPIKVTVGMYVNDIQAIDLRTHSYSVDFYLWFRWSDPEVDPIGSFEFMNPSDPKTHVKNVIFDEPQPQPDGSLYQIIRHQGLFSSKFPVGPYPFDRQELSVVLEDAEQGAEALQYMADEKPLTLNPEIKLPGYRIEDARVVVRDKHYATAFGNLAEPDESAYSRVEFIVGVNRPVVSGMFKTLIPVLVIILCGALSLLLEPIHVGARVGLAATSLLTLVALKFTMQRGLPEVAYLTLLDQIYLTSFAYIIAVIALHVITTRVDPRGDLPGSEGRFVQLFKDGRVLLSASVTGIYLLVILAVIGFNLRG